MQLKVTTSIFSICSIIVNHFLLDYFVTLGVQDVELDPDCQQVDKSQLGIYVSLGQMLLDVLVLSSGQNTVKVPLQSPESKEKVTIIVKSLGRDEVKVGSISIP